MRAMRAPQAAQSELTGLKERLNAAESAAAAAASAQERAEARDVDVERLADTIRTLQVRLPPPNGNLDLATRKRRITMGERVPQIPRIVSASPAAPAFELLAPAGGITTPLLVHSPHSPTRSGSITLALHPPFSENRAWRSCA